MPSICVKDVLHVSYRCPDLELIERFLTDFGLIPSWRSKEALYMRGASTTPFIYQAQRADSPGFSHAAFEANSHADLEQLSNVFGASSIQPAGTPFGGEQVVLCDPDGYEVHVVHGFRRGDPLEMRAPLSINNASRKVRFNAAQRPPMEAAPVLRLGHLVFKVRNIAKSIAWYEQTLGMKVSDSVHDGDEHNRLVAFLRCDRGSAFTDHHTLALAQAPADAPLGVHHISFETQDFDAVAIGHEWLKRLGWRHVWGVGRHVLGSQVFDYWRDPYGNMVEHFADGDLYDASKPTESVPAGPQSLYLWGPPVPDEFMS